MENIPKKRIIKRSKNVENNIVSQEEIKSVDDVKNIDKTEKSEKKTVKKTEKTEKKTVKKIKTSKENAQEIKNDKKVEIHENVDKKIDDEKEFDMKDLLKGMTDSEKEFYEKKMIEMEKSVSEGFTNMNKSKNKDYANEIIDVSEEYNDEQDNDEDNVENQLGNIDFANNPFIKNNLNEFLKQMFLLSKMNKKASSPEKKVLPENIFLQKDLHKEDPQTQEKTERIRMLEERGDFLDLRVIEPHDYYKGFLELLTQLHDIEPIDIIQFTSYIVNLHTNYKQIWVVEDKRYNVIVGTVTLILEYDLFSKMSKYCRIKDLVVHEGIRKYGLGRTLVNHILKIAREINCFSVVLNSDDKNIKFYENCGFQKGKTEMTIGVTPTSVFRLEHDLLNDPDPFES